MSASRLCEAVGLNKTTIYYLVESLATLGFAERSEQLKGYRLGLRSLELGRAVQRRLNIATLSRPSLIRLCAATRETVNLAVPYVFDALIAESIEGSYGVRATSYVGTRSHYHSTACGKAMLAHFDAAARRALYAARPLAPATPNTITDPDALERQLEDVRKSGHAFDFEENELSANCVAAPIFDGFGQVAGAISLSGISSRMTCPVMLDLADRIAAETRTIGQALSTGTPG